MTFNKKLFDKNFFLLILIIPFFEFINQNYIEFNLYITFYFLIYSIFLFASVIIFFFIIKNFFYNTDFVYFRETFSLIIYLLFKFSLIKSSLSEHMERYDGELSFILLILLSILIIKIYKTRLAKNFIKIFLLFNFLFIVASIIFGFASQKSLKNFKISNESYLFKNQSTENLKKENIYFVIVDGMTSLKNYEEKYNLSNQEFKNFVSSFNLDYYDGRSSYGNTVLSFTSLLNLNYIVTENDAAFTNRSRMYPYIMRPNMIDKYSLPKTLKNLGYKFIWESIPHPGTCFQYNIDLCMNKKFSKTELMLKKIKLNSYIYKSFLSATPIFSIVARLGIFNFFDAEGYDVHKANDAIGNFIKKVDNYDYSLNPHFFLIHHMSPKEPHIYNADCSRRQHIDTKEINPVAYSLAYQCVLKKIKQLINFISEKDPNGIIIIQGDHGVDSGKNLKEKDISSSKVFYLLKLNTRCKSINLNGKLDMVNNARLSLSCATNQKVKFVDKRTFVKYPKEHRNKGKVFRIEDIESIKY